MTPRAHRWSMMWGLALGVLGAAQPGCEEQPWVGLCTEGEVHIGCSRLTDGAFDAGVPDPCDGGGAGGACEGGEPEDGGIPVDCTLRGQCAGQASPGAEDCTTPVDENCDGVGRCTGGSWWGTSLGDEGDQFALDLAVDAAGNVVVTGGFRGVLSLGGEDLVSAGGEDIFVVKFDPCGAVMWAKRFGDPQFQEARSVDVDQHGNILIAGWLQGSVDFGGGPLVSNGLTDGFVAKLDPDGNPLWSTSFGDREEQFAHDVAVDDSDNVILTGSFWSTVNFGLDPLVSAGFEDLFVVKLSPSGEPLWNARFGDEETQEGLSLATDPEGNIVVTGYMLGTLDFAQHPLVSTGTDVMLLKLTPDGAPLWGRRFGEQGFQYGQRVAVDAQGNIALSGGFSEAIHFGGGLLSSEGGFDLFLAMFDPDGNAQWHRHFGAPGDQYDILCAADAAGNVVVTGSFSGEIHLGGGVLESHGSEDIFVAKFDGNGEPLWSSRYGDSSFQSGWGVTTDSLGNILVAGAFTGSIDLGNASISGAGNKAFVASFRP